VPGVRRYFSVFWGPLLMLLKLFDYLSDGRTLLVGVLGVFCFQKYHCIFLLMVTGDKTKNRLKWGYFLFSAEFFRPPVCLEAKNKYWSTFNVA